MILSLLGQGSLFQIDYKKWAQKDLNNFTDKAFINISLSDWNDLLQTAYRRQF